MHNTVDFTSLWVRACLFCNRIHLWTSSCISRAVQAICIRHQPTILSCVTGWAWDIGARLINYYYRLQQFQLCQPNTSPYEGEPQLKHATWNKARGFPHKVHSSCWLILMWYAILSLNICRMFFLSLVIWKDGANVGHVAQELARICWYLLHERHSNSGGSRGVSEVFIETPFAGSHRQA